MKSRGLRVYDAFSWHNFRRIFLSPPGPRLQARPRARAVGEGAGEAGGEEEEERERGQEGRSGLLRLLPKGREDEVSLKAVQNSTEVLYLLRLDKLQYSKAR